MAFFAKNLLRLSENSDREEEIKITDAPYFVKIPVRLKISVGSKNFGTSVGKPSGVVQVFRTSERIAGSTGRKAGEPERMQEHTTTEGEQESHKGKAGRKATNKEFFLLIYRYHRTK